ncbi:MAG: hypothetical protein JO185_17960, partial [Acidobacteriaceae bacterium]|nr:hypothetical protein [Acidobacteriaceae bacterium]
SNADSAQIRVIAPPGAEYVARSVVSGTDLGPITAAQLMQPLTVRFPPDHSVEIIELRRRKG